MVVVKGPDHRPRGVIDSASRLAYRAFSFWLPTIPGILAYVQLRRTVARSRPDASDRQAGSRVATATQSAMTERGSSVTPVCRPKMKSTSTTASESAKA